MDVWLQLGLGGAALGILYTFVRATQKQHAADQDAARESQQELNQFFMRTMNGKLDRMNDSIVVNTAAVKENTKVFKEVAARLKEKN